jgi:hypothetical protein
VKKIPKAIRLGRDIGEVLERHLLKLSSNNTKTLTKSPMVNALLPAPFQMIRNSKTLEIFLSGLLLNNFTPSEGLRKLIWRDENN